MNNNCLILISGLLKLYIPSPALYSPYTRLLSVPRVTTKSVACINFSFYTFWIWRPHFIRMYRSCLTRQVMLDCFHKNKHLKQQLNETKCKHSEFICVGVGKLDLNGRHLLATQATNLKSSVRLHFFIWVIKAPGRNVHFKCFFPG